MRIDLDRIKELCKQRDKSVTALLNMAGVSRNAFYTLARKESVLPASVRAIADSLGVAPSEFLREDGSAIKRAQALLAEVEEIASNHMYADPSTIRHTLILLEERPIKRLRRALQRAR